MRDYTQVNNMNLFSPTTIKELCATYGFAPSKAYGQNYLISESAITKMVAAGELAKSDTVVEIGPGFGVLTTAVAPEVAQVYSFEIEQTLRPYWEDMHKTYPNVEMIWGNAMYTFQDHVANFPAGYKVMANLPYQITSQLLRMLLETVPAPERIVAMVQKEVAQRICEAPGQMSLLALSVQYYGEPKTVTNVPSGSFWPAPKVDSAVIAINSIGKAPRASTPEQFFAIAKAAYASKRKKMMKNVVGGTPFSAEQVAAAMEAEGLSSNARAQELSVHQFDSLAATLYS
mgnify:CR=1 FL=1|jgi:16S rRNA (adenine1518-N6/adenine1519-N6)-dimethyltransferase